MLDPWHIEGIMLWQSNLIVGSAINAIHMFNPRWSRFSVLSSFKYCPNVKYHSLQETWWDHEWNNTSCCGTIIGMRNNDKVGKGVSFFFKAFSLRDSQNSNATKSCKSSWDMLPRQEITVHRVMQHNESPHSSLCNVDIAKQYHIQNRWTRLN